MLQKTTVKEIRYGIIGRQCRNTNSRETCITNNQKVKSTRESENFMSVVHHDDVEYLCMLEHFPNFIVKVVRAGGRDTGTFTVRRGQDCVLMCLNASKALTV